MHPRVPAPTAPRIDRTGVTRRRVLTAAAGVAGAAAVGGLPIPGVSTARPANAAARPTGDRPNFVVVLADDTGWGAFGAYGQQHVVSPNLDEMAHQGIAFTDTYAGAPICAPSRCSLLTGMHTGHARVRDNNFTVTGDEPTLLPEDTTFAQVLKRAGYATGAFGKWGFGPDDCYVPIGAGVAPGIAAPSEGGGGPAGDLDQNVGHDSHPLQKGFDEFYGLVRHHHATEGYWPSYLWDGNQRVIIEENEGGEVEEVYAPTAYVERTLDFIERNADQPFVAYVGLQNAHWPNHVPSTEPYTDRVGWTEEMKRYAAQITLIDTYTGMIRDKLVELGLDDNTIVFVSSDNGPTEERAAVGGSDEARHTTPSVDSAIADIAWDMTGGLRSKKHSMYDGGLRVPMIVWGPGLVRTDGATVGATPWQFADLLPTLADFAGADIPPDIDGASVRAWITGDSDGEMRPLYFERPPYAGLNVDGKQNASNTYVQVVREGRWKCLRYALGHTDPNAPDERWEVELFDMQADRGEMVNLALLNPDVVARMVTTMKASHAPQPFAREPWPQGGS